METFKASIAIFQNSVEYEDVTQPHVPKEIFETAKRVIENKSCELVKLRDGLYIVKYSETGPFPQKIGDEWLPIYVARMHKWSSGGIKKSEFEEFEANQCQSDET